MVEPFKAGAVRSAAVLTAKTSLVLKTSQSVRANLNEVNRGRGIFMLECTSKWKHTAGNYRALQMKSQKFLRQIK